MGLKVAILLYPGTWSERDFAHAFSLLGIDHEVVWHADADLRRFDAAIVPGGFSYGDHLRAGAIAKISPATRELRRAAAEGMPILGSCNGFQILCEAGLLPGALQKNRGLKFLCTTVDLRVETQRSPLTQRVAAGTVLAIPINHFEGNYTCSPATLAELRGDDRIVLRYVDNPNGSIDGIAGVCSAGRNVVGLMPHPERAYDPMVGSGDGVALLASFLASAGAWSPPMVAP